MSDLISRKDLQEIIAQTKRAFTSENQDYYKGYICALSGLEGVIAGQSVAYDVDKVLEALEEKRNYSGCIFEADYFDGLEEAIEIVKGGGVNERD